MKKRLVALVIGLGVGATSITANTQTVEAVGIRETIVVLSAQYFDDSMNLMDDFIEASGNYNLSYWDADARDYRTMAVTLSGSGDYYSEPYTIADDAMVGDVFTAYVDTKGTITKADDELHLGGYLGTILPSNY